MGFNLVSLSCNARVVFARSSQEGAKRGSWVACKNGLILMELAIGTSGTEGLLLCANSFRMGKALLFSCAYIACVRYIVFVVAGLLGYIIGTQI